MKDLKLDYSQISNSFPVSHTSPYTLIEVPEESSASWPSVLAIPMRRCYIPDADLVARANKTESTEAEVLAAKLPDKPAIMSGDFGEILAFLRQGCELYPKDVIGPKKWRLKHDRNAAAPGSDVVQFVLPRWPNSSRHDVLICAEVKAKATKSSKEPIKEALEGSTIDRVRRLTKTLYWLRDRALGEDLGSVTIQHLDRFLKPYNHPNARKRFQAIAVICQSLKEAELANKPEIPYPDQEVVVLIVPNLKVVYERLYDAVLESAEDGDSK